MIGGLKVERELAEAQTRIVARDFLEDETRGPLAAPLGRGRPRPQGLVLRVDEGVGQGVACQFELARELALERPQAELVAHARREPGRGAEARRVEAAHLVLGVLRGGEPHLADDVNALHRARRLGVHVDDAEHGIAAVEDGPRPEHDLDRVDHLERNAERPAGPNEAGAGLVHDAPVDDEEKVIRAVPRDADAARPEGLELLGLPADDEGAHGQERKRFRQRADAILPEVFGPDGRSRRRGLRGAFGGARRARDHLIVERSAHFGEERRVVLGGGGRRRRGLRLLRRRDALEAQAGRDK
jgi:hypothetical protein